MKQEQVTEKIMRILVSNDLIDLEDYDVIAPFIDQAYAAGFVEGKLKPSGRRPVVQLSKDFKEVCVFESTMAAERITRISNQSISACAIGKRNHNTAGGYKWRYLDEYSGHEKHGR